MIMRSVLDEKASRVIEVLLFRNRRPIDERENPRDWRGWSASSDGLGRDGYCIAAPRAASPMAGMRVIPLSLIIYFAIFYLWDTALQRDVCSGRRGFQFHRRSAAVDLRIISP